MKLIQRKTDWVYWGLENYVTKEKKFSHLGIEVNKEGTEGSF